MEGTSRWDGINGAPSATKTRVGRCRRYIWVAFGSGLGNNNQQPTWSPSSRGNTTVTHACKRWNNKQSCPGDTCKFKHACIVSVQSHPSCDAYRNVVAMVARAAVVVVAASGVSAPGLGDDCLRLFRDGDLG